MVEDVKAPAQRSSRRTAAARETRRVITETAVGLFVEGGYTGTSMHDIAVAADVADKTLYLTFGNKAELLRAAADYVLAGDDDPVPIAQRFWFKELLATPDPRQALERWVDGQERQLRRISDLIETVKAAADSDPEIAVLYRERRSQLLADVRLIAAALSTRGELRDGLSEADAAEHLNVITGPEVYRVLVIDQKWTRPRYRAWAQHNLETYLLAPIPPTG